MHGFLEWKWIYLTINWRIEEEKRDHIIVNDANRLIELQENIEHFFFDLFLASASKFNKVFLAFFFYLNI